jgi:hypothetical protein
MTRALCLALFAVAFSTLAQAQEADSPAPTPTRTWPATWLDPQGEFWEPRRGERWEVAAFLGAETPIGELQPQANFPEWGGMAMSGALRYYAVDRMALILGLKSYVGLDRPAAGTEAATVITPLAGVRYDLVRENRFSLLADVTSGPAAFAFADVSALDGAQWAVGGELGAAVSARYSLGPFTTEARALLGGRAGAPAGGAERPGTESGPFSSVYGGFDLGLTWSL